MNEVTGFSLLFAFVGMLFITLSIPLILKKVPPNRAYGYRTRKTLSDPKIWYQANHLFGKDFLISGMLTLFASLFILAFGRGMKPDYVVITLLSVMLFSLGGAVWHSFKYVRQL